LYLKDRNFQSFKDIFLKFKADTEIYDNDGNTFLNLAIQCDCRDIVIFLLYKGANPNTQNFKMNTPLHYVLSYQNFDLTDILIKNRSMKLLKIMKN